MKGEWHVGRAQSAGIELIANERQRQIDKEGFTDKHDKQHDGRELVMAAVAYAVWYLNGNGDGFPTWRTYFPFLWSFEWWKPSEDPIRNLVKAGALIAAEIDRLQKEKEGKGE